MNNVRVCMCVKEKTAVLSQQGWSWQSADRPFKKI